MVDEEVAIRTRATGVSWILYCGIMILLHRNKDHKRREALARATSSSTANAVPLPRWGRLFYKSKFEMKKSLSLRVGSFLCLFVFFVGVVRGIVFGGV